MFLNGRAGRRTLIARLAVDPQPQTACPLFPDRLAGRIKQSVEKTDGWITALSTIADERPTLRGRDLLTVAQQNDFTSVVFFACRGSLPTDAERAMLDMVLGSGIIHGVAPTGSIARALARSGVPTQVAIAGSLLSLGDIHGGAGEQLGSAFHAVAAELGISPGDAWTQQTVDGMAAGVEQHFRSRGLRVPGLGHPAHPDGDPRAVALLRRADALSVADLCCATLRSLERSVGARARRPIPANIDGAMIAILCDLGFDPRYARVFLMVSRAVGLGAQVLEEIDHPSPRWRDAILGNETYVGPPVEPVQVSG